MVKHRTETTEDWIRKRGDRHESSDKAEEKPKGIKTKGETTVDMETKRRNQTDETKARIAKEEDTHELTGSLSLCIQMVPFYLSQINLKKNKTKLRNTMQDFVHFKGKEIIL